jgi:Kef-type K+ transport system membrane component KefB
VTTSRPPLARTYALLVGLPLIALVAILAAGRGVTAPPAALPVGPATPPPAAAALLNIPLLLAQIIVVLMAARLMGALLRRVGQPQVVSEMIAGIVLGPSVFGWLVPRASATLFPPSSLGFLNALSQIGLLVFMFLVGLELDWSLLRERARSALIVSHASMVAPFLLGALLALLLYPRLSNSGVTFAGFALFMGAAMSVTAFPVLARIIAERRLQQTRLGALAIACAAVDDVTAWCILATVVVIVRASASAMPLWVTLIGSAAYVGVAVTGGRRALGWLAVAFRRRGRVTQDMIGLIVLVVFASAWVTERFGIHALFGAFLVGAIIPREAGLVRGLLDRFEDLMVVLLLPLFFAFTGLRTRVGLVTGGELWLYFALILAVAIAGKLGGSAIAARATGMAWRESGALGVLMNTRGLMELVILNVGLDIGVISPTLFAMLVLMALTTTVMTTPILAWLYPAARAVAAEPAHAVPAR